MILSISLTENPQDSDFSMFFVRVEDIVYHFWDFLTFKDSLNSEWIYEVIISPKMPTKNYQDFCPGSLLEGNRAEILVIFGWYFGRNDELINSFWI